MKNTGKSNTVENMHFRFVAWNSIHLHNTSKLALFKFDELLKRSLRQSFIFEKYFPDKLKRNITIGILTGQVSVMRVEKKNSEFKLKTKVK